MAGKWSVATEGTSCRQLLRPHKVSWQSNPRTCDNFTYGAGRALEPTSGRGTLKSWHFPEAMTLSIYSTFVTILA